MNKKVLVTGSTRGIGRAIAEKFHTQGWNVVITARGEKEINDVTSHFCEKRKNSAIGIKADLALATEIILLKEEIEKNWLNLDCIVFNIGSGSGTKGLSTTAAENERILRINFLDVTKTCDALLPLIKKKANSRIIFIGSIAQEINVNAPISYAYAKRALSNYAVSKSMELASQNISVNVINPGHILTKDGVWERKMLNSKDEFSKFVSEKIPLGKIGQPEEVADLTFAMVNNEFSNYLTGASITVDGGATLSY
jgi:3-oxoacyl-[acyl-carrier protein] reductase